MVVCSYTREQLMSQRIFNDLEDSDLKMSGRQTIGYLEAAKVTILHQDISVH